MQYEIRKVKFTEINDSSGRLTSHVQIGRVIQVLGDLKPDGHGNYDLEALIELQQ